MTARPMPTVADEGRRMDTDSWLFFMGHGLNTDETRMTNTITKSTKTNRCARTFVMHFCPC